MFDIGKELKKLPELPGVYIMRDINNTIIYVGKAISLKNRVRQYFMKNNKRSNAYGDSSKLVTEVGQGASSRNKTLRIEKMVSLIDHFEYIVCDNEAEALILECNLIKQNRPRFNVLLKDDKGYPYIKINLKEKYPNVFMTRNIKNDGAKYFGPFADAGAVKELIDFIKRNFKIRLCKSYKHGKRECLNYHIDRCPAPCANKITPEEYRKTIDQIIMLIERKNR